MRTQIPIEWQTEWQPALVRFHFIIEKASMDSFDGTHGQVKTLIVGAIHSEHALEIIRHAYPHHQGWQIVSFHLIEDEN